jgi:hypothetical protein
MKSYKQLISEVAQPKPEDEIEFVSKHVIDVLDYPESEDAQHTGANVKKKGGKRIADYDTGEDMAVYESDMDENAFIMAASDAKVKGKKKFNFDGKEYPVKIKDDIAKKVVGEGIDYFNLDEESFEIFLETATTDQLNEFIGKIAGKVVRGAAKAIGAGARRMTVAGRADAAEKRANAMEKKRKDMERLKKAKERIAKLQSTGKGNSEDMKKAKESLAKKQKKMTEELTDVQKKKRQEIVLAMKKGKKDLKDRYGDDWESVMYATATKKAKNESLDESKFNDYKVMVDGKHIMTVNAKDEDQAYKIVDGQLQHLRKFVGKASPAVKDLKVKKWSGRLPEYDQIEIVKESLDEATISDTMKLKDGSSVKVSKDEQSMLNSLYKNLKGSNKNKMEETMMRDKKGFQEILRFAKEVYEE